MTLLELHKLFLLFNNKQIILKLDDRELIYPTQTFIWNEKNLYYILTPIKTNESSTITIEDRIKYKSEFSCDLEIYIYPKNIWECDSYNYIDDKWKSEFKIIFEDNDKVIMDIS